MLRDLARGYRRFVAAAATALVTAAGCSDDTTGPPPDPPETLAPGTTLPLGTTVRIGTSASHGIPAGAVSLTTRCFGRVTVTFTPSGGAMESNTCDSADGSSNQTNAMAGVTVVAFDLAAGAYAHATVQ